MESMTGNGAFMKKTTKNKLLLNPDLKGSNEHFSRVLSSDALDFIGKLQRKFNPERKRLLEKRAIRQKDFNQGKMPDFLSETEEIRHSEWTVAEAPQDLRDRRVEITGPVERKMMINALNSGANVFMADCEDSHSPTWEGTIQGQVNLIDAVQRKLFFSEKGGKEYRLNSELATLVLRPRGWHLEEQHVEMEGEAVSASLFDFGLYFFHNAKELIRRGSGPYFYLPKLENHKEARLWNEVFRYSQDCLGIPQGSVRATVLIEHILAAFEMHEILYELKEHAAGLNAGRWDYIFSIIKTFRNREDFVLPDRTCVTMAVPFMRSYAELLVKTCHRRNAHALGGMAAFIPSRKDEEVNRVAIQKVTEDKERECQAGFDGTWVAHPDLVPVAQRVFTPFLASKPHQKEKAREDVRVGARDLLAVNQTPGWVTKQGLRNNISVCMQYLNQWLQGRGAVAIFNLMEDAATAEISRSQIWQWISLGAHTHEGQEINADYYLEIRKQELEKLGGISESRYKDAVQIMDGLILNPELTEFLTHPAYERLVSSEVYHKKNA
jgi:malate synthase